MSDNFLKLIPQQPQFVPDAENIGQALKLLISYLIEADEISVIISREVRFIDPSGNWEAVLCPNCKANLNDWVGEAINLAYQNSAFENLAIVTPCCRFHTSLNDLEYHWPAGFARFSIEARNPFIGGELEQNQLSKVEATLSCRLRQILAHL